MLKSQLGIQVIGFSLPSHRPCGEREDSLASLWGPKDESFVLSKFFAILGYYINAKHNYYEL